MFKFLKKKNNYCPVCAKSVIRFNPIPESFIAKLQDNMYRHSIFAAETLNINNYNCPNCSCSDRDRLYALYFNKLKVENKLENIKTFIDFAPAVPLSAYFKKLNFKNYRTADLFMKNVNDKVDLTDMPLYADGSVDAFLCSHILEHIPNDEKAIKELHRILSLNGFGIIMVPINLVNDSIYENVPVANEAERWHHYGQFDHVRLYNKSGFIERLQKGGFKIEQLGAYFFGAQSFTKCGIHQRSVLYVVRK